MKHIKRTDWAQTISLWQLDKLIVVLTAMCVLPFLVHLIPIQSVKSLGTMWLPIFYAPLVAVICFRPHVALIAALIAPMINRVFVGLPDPIMANMLTLELIIFVVTLEVLCARKKDFWAMSLIAYSIAKMISIFVWKVVPGLMSWQATFVYFVNAVAIALPGLCVLFVIHFLVVHLKEKKAL